MSGTSMDGVDASIIQSDGENKYKPILDKYFEYPRGIYNHLTKLRDKIKSSKDLKKFLKEIKNIEKEITLFHAKAVNQILKKTKVNVDLIGFHGQTIYHNAKEKISRQLGNGKLLSKLTKKTVIFNFRQNDLKHGGQGAPLAPIFHKLLVNQNKIRVPVFILNIGGIANITRIDHKKNFSSYDVGPGNCMIDEWIRFNFNNKKKFDKSGKIAKSGKVNSKILNKMFSDFLHNYPKKIKMSYDVKNFDLSYVKKLSVKNGAATLTSFTATLIFNHINEILDEIPSQKILSSNEREWRIFVCGGGRKNETLMYRIFECFSNALLPYKIKYYFDDNFFRLIDELDIDGDFIESQAFAYLAIRSYLKLPISFPETTGTRKPCTGGVIVKY